MKSGAGRKWLFRILKGLGSIVLSYFIWAVFDALNMKTTIINSLVHTLPRKIINLAIPDIIFLSMIIVILLILWTHNQKLKGLSLDPTLVFQENVYWKMQKDNEPEGPYCPKCYDANRKQIHMIKVLDTESYKCPDCGLRVARPSGRVGPPMPGRTT